MTGRCFTTSKTQAHFNSMRLFFQFVLILWETSLYIDNSLLQKYDSFGLGIVIGNPLRFGSVNFENCSPEQLRLFRLIPEKGKKLSIPINGKNPKIDGVWVKGNRNWLKIPNHCYATITCEEKCKSSYKYTIYCNLAISLIKGTGGFVPDAGSTTHGTDYPF